MAMSPDGFIAGPEDGPGKGLGTSGLRLHEWLGEPVAGFPHFDPPGVSGKVFAEVMRTGAIVVSRKTFDYAGPNFELVRAELPDQDRLRAPAFRARRPERFTRSGPHCVEEAVVAESRGSFEGCEGSGGDQSGVRPGGEVDR